MYGVIKEHVLLETAINRLETLTGAKVNVRLAHEDKRSETDAILDLQMDDRQLSFATTIKRVDRSQVLGLIKQRQAAIPCPLLIVAPYISTEMAEHCRKLELYFLDSVGNAYIKAPGLLIDISGKPRPERTLGSPRFSYLTPTGLRITFALLSRPNLAGAPYRHIAGAAGVSLGSVSDALADLDAQGYLAPEMPGPRRLLAPDRLREEWVAHYASRLRPKLHGRRFKAPSADWWREVDLYGYDLYWGGEAAAEKMTGYLKAAAVTLYATGRPDALILAHRLRPDSHGDVEILDAFWPPDAIGHDNDCVPALLVFADLINSGDPRNLETARIIHEQYLSQADHTH